MACYLAAGSALGDSGGLELHTIADATRGSKHWVDTAPTGPSQGDTFVFDQPLMNQDGKFPFAHNICQTISRRQIGGRQRRKSCTINVFRRSRNYDRLTASADQQDKLSPQFVLHFGKNSLNALELDFMQIKII